MRLKFNLQRLSLYYPSLFNFIEKLIERVYGIAIAFFFIRNENFVKREGNKVQRDEETLKK